jgi:hypothetical protein
MWGGSCHGQHLSTPFVLSAKSVVFEVCTGKSPKREPPPIFGIDENFYPYNHIFCIETIQKGREKNILFNASRIFYQRLARLAHVVQHNDLDK